MLYTELQRYIESMTSLWEVTKNGIIATMFFISQQFQMKFFSVYKWEDDAFLY